MINDLIRQLRVGGAVKLTVALLFASSGMAGLQAQAAGAERGLQITVNQTDGTYAVAMPGSNSYALRAGVAVEVDGHWLRARDFR